VLRLKPWSRVTRPVEEQPLCTYMASVVNLTPKAYSIKLAAFKMDHLPIRTVKFKLITAMDLLTNPRCLQG
jgi:hypothetical protein